MVCLARIRRKLHKVFFKKKGFLPFSECCWPRSTSGGPWRLWHRIKKTEQMWHTRPWSIPCRRRNMLWGFKSSIFPPEYQFILMGHGIQYFVIFGTTLFYDLRLRFERDRYWAIYSQGKCDRENKLFISCTKNTETQRLAIYNTRGVHFLTHVQDGETGGLPRPQFPLKSQTRKLPTRDALFSNGAIFCTMFHDDDDTVCSNACGETQTFL